MHYQDGNLDQCAQPGQCGQGYVQVACNGEDDCPNNQVCCGDYAQYQNYYVEVGCVQTCASTNPQIAAILMCGDNPNICPSPQTCHQSQFLPTGHSYCQ